MVFRTSRMGAKRQHRRRRCRISKNVWRAGRDDRTHAGPAFHRGNGNFAGGLDHQPACIASGRNYSRQRPERLRRSQHTADSDRLRRSGIIFANGSESVRSPIVPTSASHVRALESDASRGQASASGPAGALSSCHRVPGPESPVQRTGGMRQHSRRAFSWASLLFKCSPGKSAKRKRIGSFERPGGFSQKRRHDRDLLRRFQSGGVRSSVAERVGSAGAVRLAAKRREVQS